MDKLSANAIAKLHEGFTSMGEALLSTDEVSTQIQVQLATALRKPLEKAEFIKYMTKTFPVMPKLVQKLQTSINKPATQRMYFGLKATDTLTHEIHVRTAMNDLVKKGVATPEQVAMKGQYFAFEYKKTPKAIMSVEDAYNKFCMEYAVTVEKHVALKNTATFVPS
jgi:hypothetical protein|tara:strand:- start:196 stop:693 length:498 start_codon:yes stop_codon:yes gene_type:complete